MLRLSGTLAVNLKKGICDPKTTASALHGAVQKKAMSTRPGCHIFIDKGPPTRASSNGGSARGRWSSLADTLIPVAAMPRAGRLWKLPRRPAQAAGRLKSHARHSSFVVVPRWKAQVPLLRAVVVLNMGPLSRGAAALEKAFLDALISIIAGGTARLLSLTLVLHLNVVCRVGAFWAPTDNSLCLGKHGSWWIFGRRP